MATFELWGHATLVCEDLVIGSGAGGAVVAEQLSALGRDVLVLEEGPYRSAQDVPTQTTKAFQDMWRGGGLTVALGKNPIAYAEGRCVGGGTEINSAIFQRAPDNILEEWGNRRRINDFSPESLSPYYDRAAKQVNASLTKGALGVASDLIKRGASRLGWQIAPLMRGQRSCVGTNLCSFGCPTGGKQSMTATLLPAAFQNGARLIARTRVKKILFKGGNASGAIAIATNSSGATHLVRVRANRVWCCAGAIHTPTLLLRSGLKGRIGSTLRLHPTIKILAEFDESVSAINSRLPLYAITEFMPDVRLGGSVTTPGVFGMNLAEDWISRRHMATKAKNVASYYAMIKSQSKGKVSPFPGAKEPIVTYTLKDQDLKLLEFGLFKLAEMVFAAGATSAIPSIRGHAGWRSMDDVKADVANGLARKCYNLMTIHLFSSCALGDDENGQSPVDSFGAVKGVNGLYIADASLIPEAPGTNPQATVMALAYRAVENSIS